MKALTEAIVRKISTLFVKPFDCVCISAQNAIVVLIDFKKTRGSL